MKTTKIIKNKITDKWLHLCSALAQAHLGFLILIRSDLDTNTLMYKQCVVHESIHIAQSRELLVIF